VRITLVTPTKNDATLLVRLPAELKEALTREALRNGRRITSEINIRLANSLKTDQEPSVVLDEARRTHYPGAARSNAAKIAGEARPEFAVVGTAKMGGLTEMEKAVLEVFRRLPPEKQLALLSLFK
jgi:Arc-like DNA binding dprotein